MSNVGEYFVYFGTYTGFRYTKKGVPTGHSRSRGIYSSRFQVSTGKLSKPVLAARVVNPFFLAVHPNHRFLYAVSEDPLSGGPSRDQASHVTAFAIDPLTGRLQLLNTAPTGGTGTCYLSLDKSGKYLFLANFGSGSVSVLRVEADGSLGRMAAFMQHIGKGTDTHYQSSPHPHWAGVSPDNRFAVVTDLGLDKVLVYRFNPSSGSLTPPDPPSVNVAPRSGPRHFAFAPSGRFGYLMSEMGGTVTTFAWNAPRGILTRVQDVSTIPRGFSGENHSAEIAITPDGRFLYQSNRRRRGGGNLFGPDSIGVFKIHPTKGTLTEVEQAPAGGIMPRSIAVDPVGAHLFAANELTNNVVVFRIAADTGRLTPARRTLKVPTPVCIKFVPVRL